MNKLSIHILFTIFGVHLFDQINHLLKRNKKKTEIKEKGPTYDFQKNAQGVLSKTDPGSSSTAPTPTERHFRELERVAVSTQERRRPPSSPLSPSPSYPRSRSVSLSLPRAKPNPSRHRVRTRAPPLNRRRLRSPLSNRLDQKKRLDVIFHLTEPCLPGWPRFIVILVLP